jgi:chromosome segregation ATPase
MPHRDPLIAAQERIAALERALSDARLGDRESVPTTIARLEQEKRVLASERDRLLAERERLTSDLIRANAALARAEDEAAKLRRDARDALAIRDQLRKQAIEEAARIGGNKRREAAESVAPAPAPARPEKRSRRASTSELVALDAHNLALPRAVPTELDRRAGVLCAACAARGEPIEMIVSPLAFVLGGRDAAIVVCLRCGASGMKRDQ